MYSFWKKKSILIELLDLYLLSHCFFFFFFNGSDIALVINFHLYDLPNDPLRSHTDQLHEWKNKATRWCFEYFLTFT